MKTKFLTLILLLIVSYGFSQKKYNVFENRSPLIERLEFTDRGMNLKLSLKGIAYVQKNIKSNSEIIGKLVKKLHNEMVGGSSKLSVDCIANQVYWHVCLYDLNKPANSREINRKLLKAVNKYIPNKKIKLFTSKASNRAANPINANYLELNLKGCRKANMYVIPPNVLKF